MLCSRANVLVFVASRTSSIFLFRSWSSSPCLQLLELLVFGIRAATFRHLLRGAADTIGQPAEDVLTLMLKRRAATTPR